MSEYFLSSYSPVDVLEAGNRRTGMSIGTEQHESEYIVYLKVLRPAEDITPSFQALLS